MQEKDFIFILSERIVKQREKERESKKIQRKGEIHAERKEKGKKRERERG